MRDAMPKAFAVNVSWPARGLDENFGYETQQRGTTVDAQNVRTYDPSTGRARGAQRAGLSKYLSAQQSNAIVQELIHATTASTAGDATSSVAVRTITSAAVIGGNVVTFDSSSFSTPTNGSGALSASAPVIFGAEKFGDLYFVDGTQAKYLDVSGDSVADWEAAVTGGSFPKNGTDYPRLITTWRGRVVVSGIKSDPHNWFMSCTDSAFDWDYAPDVPTNTQAVAGNNSEAGKIGDVVNAIIPINDDLLIFGGDHTLWRLSGDPLFGGQVDNVSQATGIAWGRAWCIDPAGTVYFFGSRGGVYRMAGGSRPERMTAGRLDESLATLDMSTTLARLAWNDREQGVHVFLTQVDGSASTHYFYDARMDAWWKDVFATANHNPRTVHVFDGDAPGDRAILLGTENGYINKWDISADDDDGAAIDSYVMFGPFSKPAVDLQLTEIQATLGVGSDDVTLSVHPGDSAEAAKAASARFSVDISAGRNRAIRYRSTGASQYIKLRNNTLDEEWAFESMAAYFRETGRTRHRSFT